MAIIREELQRVTRLWNLHRIRPSTRNNSSPHGRPCLLYYHPEMTGAVDCKHGRPCLLYYHPEMTGAVDCKHDADIDDSDVARDMGCSDLPMN